jgi:hypothetical protein
MDAPPPGHVASLYVWPAQLPAGARWLPYRAEPAEESESSVPLAPAPLSAAPLPRVRLHVWRVLVVAAVGGGLLGIVGGIVAGLLLGAQ